MGDVGTFGLLSLLVILQGAYPALGFFQNSRLVLPLEDEKPDAPKTIYVFPMAALTERPDRSRLVEKAPIVAEWESTKTREELSSLPSEKSFFVPTETRRAAIYKLDYVPSVVKKTPTPVLVFDQSLRLIAGYSQRWVSVEDVEFRSGRFVTVERSVEAFFPAYSVLSGETDYRLLDLENGTGSSVFLQTIVKGECVQSKEYSFYFPDQNHRTVNEEFLDARCGVGKDFP